MQARYQTAAEYAYAQLKQMIISSELTPGERINQDLLAERLNLSRLPLRTALERLEAEGFVTVLPHRGALVRELSLEEFDEIHEIRLLLEKMAMLHAADHLTAEQMSVLEDVINRADEALRRGDLPELMALNREFHFRIYRAGRRPLLLNILENLWDRHERYRRLFLRSLDRAARAAAEHRYILQLLREGRGPEASAFLEQHYHHTQLAIRQQFIRERVEGGEVRT